MTRLAFLTKSALAVALVCAAAPAQQPRARADITIGEVVAMDASVHGSVVLTGAGTRVLSGSSVSAGEGEATLMLARGGSVRICPRTALSVSASASGRELMLGFGSGALELNYPLTASADTLQTPDLRLLLAGPGTFHVAIGADARGNTCVKPLAGNSAALIASELMSDATYQVKADEQVVFASGKLSQPRHEAAIDCGCPPVVPSPQIAAAAPPPQAGTQTAASAPSVKPPAVQPAAAAAQPAAVSLPAELRLARPAEAAGPTRAEVPVEAARTETAPSAPAAVARVAPTQPLPPGSAGQVHVEVEAPFVFRGDEPAPPPEIVATVRLTDRAPVLAMSPLFLPAPELATAAEKQPQKRGFFSRIRSLFAAAFR